MRRLTILIATVGALLLIPAAQALANGTLTVGIVGEEGGSGEVSSVGGFFEGSYKGSPPIECSGPPASGVCTSTLSNEGEGIEAIALRAFPSPGSEMLGWAIEEGEAYPESCEGEEGILGEKNWICIVYVETGAGNAKATAYFACEEGETCEETPKGPPLTLNYEEGSGTVVSNPAGLECTKSAPESCTTEAVEAGSVTLTASPAPGYLFKGWKGCVTVNGRQCTISLAEPGKTVGVKFVKAFSLDVTKSNPNGIAGTSPGGVNCGFGCNSSSALYKEGSVTVKTKPAKHFHFVKFQNGTGSASSCNGSEAETCTFTLSSNSAIEEVYAEDAKNTLSLSKTGGGQGLIKTKPTSINCGYTCTAAEGEFFFNEEAAVTVTLNKGTTSVTWTTGAGTCTGNALTCSVPMSSSKTLVAKFE